MKDIKILTRGDYDHIKESGFNPKICQECQEIDAILQGLVANANCIKASPDLHKCLKGWLDWFAQETIAPPVTASKKALTKAEGGK